MLLRVRWLISIMLLAACGAALAASHLPPRHWVLFGVYAAAVVLTSGMKVSMLRTDSSMSANFPFIMLSVIELSPLQAMLVAAISVAAQSRLRKPVLFSSAQILFNLANALLATGVCWVTYAWMATHGIEAAPALAAGSSLYFFFNSAAASLAVAWSMGRSPVAFWRTHMAWFLPFYIVGAALAALAHFLGSRFGMGTALLVLPAAYTIYRSYNAQLARLRDRQQHVDEMQALHLRTIESLAMAIEAKDQETHDHLLRVRVYVTALGEALGLSHDELEAVKIAALLHDIGKLAVPEHIINKPGKLTPAEFAKMKIHPVVGADILERVRFPYPVVPIVRAHHEWWNGNGYPDGLAGEAIPIGARILTVVDCFDAMASDRPYRRALPQDQAMAAILRMSGTQFDPRVVEEMHARYGQLEQLAREESAAQAHQGLKTQIHVVRGAEPGAGFASEGDGGAGATGAGLGEARAEGEPGSGPGDFRLLAELLTEAHRIRVAHGQGADLGDLLPLWSAQLAARIPFHCMVFYLREGTRLHPVPADALARHLFRREAFAEGEGISGWVAGHHRSILNGNPGVEPAYAVGIEHGGAQEALAPGLRSALALPLYRPGGEMLGVLTLYTGAAQGFNRDHLRALELAEGTISATIMSCLRVQNCLQRGEQTLAEPLGARIPRAPAFDAASTEVLFGVLGERLAASSGLSSPFSVLLCEGAENGAPPSPPLWLASGDAWLRWGTRHVLVTQTASGAELGRKTEDLLAHARAGEKGAPGWTGCGSYPLDGNTPEALLAAAERRWLAAAAGAEAARGEAARELTEQVGVRAAAVAGASLCRELAAGHGPLAAAAGSVAGVPPLPAHAIGSAPGNPARSTAGAPPTPAHQV